MGQLVSVVIPTYNNDPDHLAEAVASAKAQTYPDVEVIVVDDGSALPVQVDGVTLIRQENAGVAAARNAGIAASQGEFVLPLDADDRVSPGTVAALHRTLTVDDRTVIAYPVVEFFGSSSGIMDVPARTELADLALFNRIVVTSLVRREHLDLAGGFDEHVDGPEDWVLWATVLGRTHGVAVQAPDARLFYRQSVTSRNVAQRTPQVIQNGRAQIAANLPERTEDLYLAAVAKAAELAARADDLAGDAMRWRRVARRIEPALAVRRRLMRLRQVRHVAG